MVPCREGHPTAKPASGAGQARISARMAANAPSAGLPGHPPSGEGQAGALVPSTGHEEVATGTCPGRLRSGILGPTLAVLSFSESL